MKAPESMWENGKQMGLGGRADGRSTITKVGTQGD